MCISAFHRCSAKPDLLTMAALRSIFESANQNREKHTDDNNDVYFELTWTMFS